jgi:hypothetical protein
MSPPDASEQMTMICPVCRARQTLQDVCRRCSADLELYAHTIRSQQHARRRYEQSLAAGDQAGVEQAREYLLWLCPHDLYLLHKGTD